MNYLKYIEIEIFLLFFNIRFKCLYFVLRYFLGKKMKDVFLLG